MTIRLLAFAASLRRGSLNRELIGVAAAIAREKGAQVDLAEFREFDMPLYNADLQESSGFPPGAAEFKRRIDAADGLLIASPEYNYSLPGTLKNAIDWISRQRPVPLRGKTALLLAASGGPIGGIRGLWQLRIPLEGCGVFVHPDMFPLATAGLAFGHDGSFKDRPTHERLEQLIAAYLGVTGKLVQQG